MFKHHRNDIPLFLRSHSPIPRQEIDPIVRLWLLRLLVPLEAHRHFITPDELP